ncbi:hypothetical protein TWF225_011265 [Orbilia oligospora]|nr:hypothetical protein TWF751_005202 [Orbilia oligospora]KAF3169637.1 hypothetical protein TWF225_011265 [Orbilia oligospora]KAF3231208.1 hypothetical protein TWF128_004937 [Orbilia oligospora]KAF3282924.1 hypothetical protein TWF132_010555 [Orbilia oligospora]
MKYKILLFRNDVHSTSIYTDRPTQTDIKFKKMLDASPMLKVNAAKLLIKRGDALIRYHRGFKSVRRLYQKLGQQTQQGIGQQQQQRPKKSTLTTGKNGRPTAAQESMQLHIKVESSSSIGNTDISGTANVKVSGAGVKQGDKTKAEKGQRNRENPMRASSDGSQSWMGNS